jgi:hypothetical protein
MSTASLSQRPIPLTAAIAAFVAAVAFTGVVVSQHDSGSPASVTRSYQVPDLPNPDAPYQRPMHGGLQPGMP